MSAKTKPLMAKVADDLMTRDVVVLPGEMPLRDAAQLLLRNQIGGAPVVDAEGKCIGVLSAIDVLRLAERRDQLTKPAEPPLPMTCQFQRKHRTPDGKDVTLCTLPPGVCPIQVKQTDVEGKEMLVCRQPHCVLVDWQIVNVEKLPTDAVRQFMTPDPVTVRPDVTIRRLAQLLVDAHIHRIIVVDEQQRPVGIVSSTDLLAAMAYGDVN